MKHTLVLAIILFSVAAARADFLYKLVGYQCDAKAGAVVLSYRGALNDAGRKMVQEKGPQQWDPWSLVVTSEDGNWVDSQRTVHGQCQLEDGVYDITIGPEPGNANLQGMCGGFITAWAEVKRGDEIVWPRQTFESGDCQVAEPVTTKVVIEAGGKQPVVTKVPFDDFARKDLADPASCPQADVDALRVAEQPTALPDREPERPGTTEADPGDRVASDRVLDSVDG